MTLVGSLSLLRSRNNRLAFASSRSATCLLRRSRQSGSFRSISRGSHEHWNGEASTPYDSVQEHARTTSLADPSDLASFPLHKRSSNAEWSTRGSQLLTIGERLADLDVNAIKAGKRSVLLTRKPLAELLGNFQDRLKWVYVRSAGIDFITSDTLSVGLTNAKGCFSSTLPEYTLLATFAMNIPRLRRPQSQNKWVKYNMEELRGSIIGMKQCCSCLWEREMFQPRLRLGQKFGVGTFVERLVRTSAWGKTSPRALSTLSDKNQEISATPAKSKKSRRRFQRMDEVPSYRDFLHRQTVLALYRQFLRTIRLLPERRESIKQIKKEFTSLQHDEAWNRKRAIQEGQRRLKDLQATVSTSVTFGQAPASDRDGERFKVGSGWPWERNKD